MYRLKDLRTSKKMTIKDLAEATGIARSTLSEIENGSRQLNIRIGEILSNYFGVTLDFLMGEDITDIAQKISKQLTTITDDMFDGVVALAKQDRTKYELLINQFLILDRIKDLPNDKLKAVLSYIEHLKGTEQWGGGVTKFDFQTETAVIHEGGKYE
jgi:transcriptional regulator with XRE-family HTH domain